MSEIVKFPSGGNEKPIITPIYDVENVGDAWNEYQALVVEEMRIRRLRFAAYQRFYNAFTAGVE